MGPATPGGNGIGGSYSLAPDVVADGFHVFTVEWTAGEIRWLVDDKEYRRAGTGESAVWLRVGLRSSFFLLLNVAVGGAWPG